MSKPPDVEDMPKTAVSRGKLHLQRGEWLTILLAFALTVLGGIFSAIQLNAVIIFFLTGAALALLAALVGQATEQLGSYLGPGATGVLQSALGNLPELFVGIFALRAGLIDVIQSALIGSILGNSLFVLGLAFFLGGLKHGTQRFDSKAPRMIANLTLLSVSALVVPTLVQGLHTPAIGHEVGLSIACAVILLVIFIASIPASMKGESVAVPEEREKPAGWPIWLAIVLLIGAGVGSAFVSDWFVNALTPAITFLHISPAFTGLVIVALAGNAVENVVGIQFALRNQTDFAISVILNSSLQVALGLIPVLVLLSLFIGGPHLTLVMPPLLVAALALTAILSTVITYDGESNLIEGLTLMGLYGIIAVSFWWG
ncbi:MAG TPA: calcium/proton exchanger [Ktedonobacteraceae bacterium]|jgi:Ca2+:H+ antiporter|nr:calcium/proton exchanger [Ktedonobacteraceae bacterium]